MKKIMILLSLCLSLLAEDIVVFNNEYNVLKLQKRIKKLIVGNKEMINVSLLSTSNTKGTLLKIFGKKSGNTSILIIYRDGSIESHHVYVNQNLGFIQKMINVIEPNLKISRVGNGSTVISGEFNNPHVKKRIYALLKNAGIDLSTLMDITNTKKVNKMVRTKLYLVEVNNQKAKDLGGVTGLNFFNEYTKASVNPSALNGVTFSGFLLDNTSNFISKTGNSIVGTLNFLQNKGIAKIIDDTVLITTEDENSSFRVGGEVYIPTGLTQNIGTIPTIQLEEKEYGLNLVLTSKFMEKDGFMHINVDIVDSQFDSNKEHYVQLGADTFVPSFVSKNIKTNVVAQSGQVIALGGRLHEEEVDNEEKVPLLGDIPLIGELFKHTVAGTKSNDLIFFLVPEIVDANEEIDDTGFYEEFKKSSNIFHEDIFDSNRSSSSSNSLVYEDTMVIELEDNVSSNELNSSKELVIKQEDLEPKKSIIEKKKKLKYEVSVEKIFLREKPVDGKRAQVWRNGHKFVSDEEKNINGAIWLRVKEDCLDECKILENDLWISKRYTRLI